jgi:sugar lactone lactonase YvrE
VPSSAQKKFPAIKSNEKAGDVAASPEQKGVAHMGKRAFIVTSVVLLLSLATVLFSCGGIRLHAPSSARLLIVADNKNNRVLIYDPPDTTGQSANVVLGQASLTTGAAGTSASTMSNPTTIAVDSIGNLFVAEDGNCRVTQFKPPFTDGMSATLAIGQPDLITGDCAAVTSANSLGSAQVTPDEVFGVIVDSNGDLWVADSGGNRVLEYIPPFSNGMAATLAIGQANLTSGSPNQGAAFLTGATLSDPVCPVFDSSGDLWIADSGNNRVLVFQRPFATGMAASFALGQPDFTHGLRNQGGAVAANTLSGASGPAFDSSGNLWVADILNNRILEFKPPFTSNMAASMVLGQADFTHGLANQGGGATPTSVTLSAPQEVTFDSSGRLIVTDGGNNRTLVFAPPFTTGMSATLVIGQANFTSAAPATTAAGQDFPTGVITAP